MTIVDSETLPPLHTDEDGVLVSDFIIKDKFAEHYAQGIYSVVLYLTPTQLVVVRNSEQSNPLVVVRRHTLREVAVSADNRVLNGIRVEDTHRTMLRYVYQLQGERTSVREWLESIAKSRKAFRQGSVSLNDPFFDGATGIRRSSPTHEFSSTVRERCVEGPAPPSLPAAFNGYGVAPVIAPQGGATLPRIRRRILSAVDANYCTLPRNVEKRKWDGGGDDEGERENVNDEGDALQPSSKSPTPPLDSPLRHETIRRGRLYSRSMSSHPTINAPAVGTRSPTTVELLPSRPVFMSKTLPRGKTKPSDAGYGWSSPKSPVAWMVQSVQRYFSSPNEALNLHRPLSDDAGDQNRCAVRKPLLRYRARDVAEQLTEIDAKLMAKIMPSEIEDEAWTSKQKNEHSPNIMAMVQAFNRLALLIPTEILEETTPQGRAKVISKYIKIASECYHLRNYNSLKSVLAGLQCAPIFRLSETWDEVPRKRRREFKRLCTIMSEENNWQLYREKLDKHFANDTPCIPFLGLFLTQIIQNGSYKFLRKARELNKSSSFNSYHTYHTRRLQTQRNSNSSLVSSRSVPSSPVPREKVDRKNLSGHFELNSGAVTSDSSESAEDILALKKAELSNGCSDKSLPLSSHSCSLFSHDDTDLSDLGFVSQEPKSDPETISHSLELDDIRLSPTEDSPRVTLPKSPTMESKVSGILSPCVGDAKESSKCTGSPCGTMTEDSFTGSNAFGSRPSLDSVFGNGCDDELRYEDIQCDIRSESGERRCSNDDPDPNRRFPADNRCSTPRLVTPAFILHLKGQDSRGSIATRNTSDSDVQATNDPQRLLDRYKMSASKCGGGLCCNPELQSLLLEGGGAPNTEQLNYKLSLEREPIHL